MPVTVAFAGATLRRPHYLAAGAAALWMFVVMLKTTPVTWAGSGQGRALSGVCSAESRAEIS
jgi:hypothetical protein